MNLIENGGFNGNLSDWEGSGTIDLTLGYPLLGCAKLLAGQEISQQINCSADQLYTVHLFFRPGSGATLTVAYGAMTRSYTGTTDQWQEITFLFAPTVASSDDLAISVSGGTVYVDNVSMLLGTLSITRSSLAVYVESQLSTIASDASLSKTPSSDGPEGDYTLAIDGALRSMGAVDIYGMPDVTRVTSDMANDLIEIAYKTMLQKMRSLYALQTDVQLGPRRESRSQIASSIDAMLAGGNSGVGSATSNTPSVGKLERANGWQR